MKGGKNNSGVPSGTDTAEPPSDTVAGDNGVSSDQPSEQERDGGAEVAGEQQGDAREEEKDEEELVDAEKPKLAEGFYEIEAVRRKRIRKGKAQYLIKWRGWPETANTWEPVENLMTCYDVIEAFEESLRSGKQQSTRKRKRKPGVTHTQVKRKQQQQDQHSPADATYNVPAVKVSIVEEPVPSSPPLASLNAVDHVDSNGSRLNNNKVDEVANGNDLELDSSVKEIEEQNELHLKISELKGVMATKEVSADRSGNDFTSGFSTANGTESLQSGRSTGAKRRKSASVRRFKPETTKGVVNDPQNAVANATSGPLVAFMQEGIHDHGFVGNAFGFNNKCDDSKDEYAITEIIKPMSYSASISSNDLQDVCVTFLAKRSDGKEVMVDNKFLKMNNPLVDF
ncbi:hypothetical protein RND71_015700 [Anisodus tanguticus]|uniref:Chromo domain-containing protein n=1 Tax=Anisodus tanguticus TaxID=243964 RepID=A0AAE1VD39_9SOLA|nr:hypothetical protein RND71_015700 [Anisodus tanguticus]